MKSERLIDQSRVVAAAGGSVCPARLEVAGQGLELMSRARGFTLIELLVVMAILALLLSIAAPRYIESVDRAKEASLQTNLRILREAIDKHRADTGKFPETLQRLVELRYLRTLPIDPVTDTAASWVLVPHPDKATPGVFDVHSGAPGASRDGTLFAAW